MQFEIKCNGHPRSLIWVPIKSTHATSYQSSTVTLVLSCPISETLQVLLLRTVTPPLFNPNFGDVPLGLDCYVASPRSKDPKLIIHANYFRSNPPYMTNGTLMLWTDRWTTYCNNTAQCTKMIKVIFSVSNR